MLGYIYKTTNTVTGEYYFCQRLFEKDANSSTVYYGSSDIVKSWPMQNKKKEIICELNSYEELDELESKMIMLNYKDPLCVNDPRSCGLGGVYEKGTCPSCGRDNVVIYKNSGVCMSCIVGKSDKYYCDNCGKDTYHYNDGRCKSCVSEAAHEKKFCEFCNKETTHFGDKCKQHLLRLVKNDDGTISLCSKRKDKYIVLVKDVEQALKQKVYDNGKSTVFDTSDLDINVKSMKDYTKVLGVIVNKDVKNWVKITYAINNRTSHNRTIVATTDHPFITESLEVKLAGDLSVGDKLKRVEAKRVGNKAMQFENAVIVEIEYLDKCSNSYDVTTENEHFNINEDIYSHNCRSFLTPDRIDGNIANATNYNPLVDKYYGRANIGVTSLNLAYIAFEAVDRDKDFFDVLDKYADLAHEMQKIRAKRISETKAKVAPILWCDGAYARLNPEDNLSKLVHNGYMTSSIGYSGLYECAKKVTGCDFWNDKKAHDFAVKVLEHLNSLCNAWKKSENIDYSIYGTPNESGTYKMALAIKRDFGEDSFEKLDGHDRDYVTNSCHIPVFEEIDAFSKLGTESEYQLLSPGGNITYIETPDMSGNLDALIEVIKFIYNNVMYSETNCESGYCSSCGRFNTIHLEGERGHYKPVCSACGNDDRSKLNYAVRVCGYISTNEFNSGRAEDVHDRVKHLDNKILKE